ncbi:MAG: hypothetical protein EYC62_06280 [Alphaproteobacteria bacterium]|nr:MAG: hypothetical protein EYC62_06280 [Alphaproteobacteria bacterium]
MTQFQQPTSTLAEWRTEDTVMALATSGAIGVFVVPICVTLGPVVSQIFEINNNAPTWVAGAASAVISAGMGFFVTSLVNISVPQGHSRSR